MATPATYERRGFAHLEMRGGRTSPNAYIGGYALIQRFQKLISR